MSAYKSSTSKTKAPDPVRGKIKDTFCATCLSRDRKMFSIEGLNLDEFCADIPLSEEEDRVCWECKAIVVKMNEFRHKACKAQALIENMIRRKKCDMFVHSLSELKIVNKSDSIIMGYEVEDDPNSSQIEQIQVDIDFPKKEIDSDDPLSPMADFMNETDTVEKTTAEPQTKIKNRPTSFLVAEEVSTDAVLNDMDEDRSEYCEAQGSDSDTDIRKAMNRLSSPSVSTRKRKRLNYNEDWDTTRRRHYTAQNDDENVDDTTNNSETNDLPLKNLLMETNEGQGLLNLYLEDGKLTNNGRRKLCHIIIQDLIKSDASKMIPNSVLIEKAQQIKDVFKKENIDTYYMPYTYDAKLKIKRGAKGKLYDCLQNRRRELRRCKVIEKKYLAPLIQPSCSSQTREEEHHAAVSESDCSEDLLWLQHYTEPWHIVKEKWQKTAKNRMNEIKGEDTASTNIHTYMAKYPVLKTQKGCELLIHDFNYIHHPSAVNSFYEKFSVIKQKLFKLAESKTRFKEVRDILEQLQMLHEDDENYEEAESVLAFMLLPFLLGNPALKSKEQIWRPSKAEVRDGFITHVNKLTDVQNTIEKRREKYVERNLAFPPTIVIVGPSYTDIQKYFVVVNDVFYETHLIQQTVDTCFKIYHALNCPYPTESTCVWNFIQIGLYRIHTIRDMNYSTVNAFITDLEIDRK